DGDLAVRVNVERPEPEPEPVTQPAPAQESSSNSGAKTLAPVASSEDTAPETPAKSRDNSASEQVDHPEQSPSNDNGDGDTWWWDGSDAQWDWGRDGGWQWDSGWWWDSSW